MRIEPSGVVMWGCCTISTEKCMAKAPDGGAITAVWGIPGRRQIDVCGACLAEMRRCGEWEIEGAGALHAAPAA